jgi:hypothetical protein
VIAGLITTAIVGVMLVIMVDEGCLAANGASRIVLHLLDTRSIRCELMVAVTALILLETILIFAITIKRVRIVALRTFK